MCNVHMMFHVITLPIFMAHDYVFDNTGRISQLASNGRSFLQLRVSKSVLSSPAVLPNELYRKGAIIVLQLSSDHNRQYVLKSVVQRSLVFYLLKFNLEFYC